MWMFLVKFQQILLHVIQLLTSYTMNEVHNHLIKNILICVLSIYLSTSSIHNGGPACKLNTSHYLGHSFRSGLHNHVIRISTSHVNSAHLHSYIQVYQEWTTAEYEVYLWTHKHIDVVIVRKPPKMETHELWTVQVCINTTA